MEKEEIKRIWDRIGITTFSIFLSLAIFGSLMIYWSNEIRKEKETLVLTAEKKAAEIIIENPELFLDRAFTDSVLKSAGYFEVTATVYNPVVEQCNSNPLLTADCSTIDLEKLISGELRWVALSRDLLKFFNYGDMIELISLQDPSINGFYEVHDTMNKRFRNYIDILKPVGSNIGKWEGVIIRKVES